MNIVLINGSPKGDKSCSRYILDTIKERIDKEKTIYEVSIYDKKIKDDDKFHIISNCDKLIISFPLYVDCLPSVVIKFLEGYESYVVKNDIRNESKIYGVVNCGFFEGTQNKLALKVLSNFTKHIRGLRYAGGIGIGTGPFIGGNKDIPWDSKIKSSVNSAIDKMIKSINCGEDFSTDLFADANMNKHIYLNGGNLGWISDGFKNKVYITNINKKVYKED